MEQNQHLTNHFLSSCIEMKIQRATTCMLMARALCNQLGSPTQNRSSQNGGTKHFIHLFGKVVLNADKAIEKIQEI